MYELCLVAGRVRNLRCATTQTGKKVCNFGLKVTRVHGDKSVDMWYEVTVWERLAEVVEQYVTDGMAVLVQGEPGAKHYQKRDGTVAAALTLNARTVKFLDRGQSRQQKEQTGDDLDDLIEGWDF